MMIRAACFLLGLVLITAGNSPGADPEGVVVVRPAAAPGPLANPLKGWCPYTNAGPISLPYSMVYHYASWRELEPTEGQFAFDAWEQRTWNVPAAQGKHVVFRVYVDYPGRPSGLPDWLKGRVKLTPYTEHGGGLSPDYENPDLVRGMERLIAALGARYDRDPRVAFVELGLLGYWGEWHTWPNEKLQPSRATEQRVIDAFHRAFPNVGLMARMARDHAGTQDWLGFHDDMFPEDTDNGHDWSFLATIRRAGRAENWQRAPIGGEMVPGAARRWLKDDLTRTMIDRSHFSWVGPYCPAIGKPTNPATWREDAAQLVRRMGYQFRWDEFRLPGQIPPGQPVAVELRGINEGVAPFYKPWPVELALLDAAGGPVARVKLDADVRTWLPGLITVRAMPTFPVPAGQYRLALGIIDPGTGQPAVEFANRVETLGGWTVLGRVEVR